MPYGSVNADKMTTSDGVSSSGLYGFKNRLINSAMVIDQRNAGASVTPNNSYTLDRWQGQNSQSSKYTVQQNAGSVTPPSGFTNYLGVTSSSAYSIVAGDYFAIRQAVEGFNIADLGWGASGASTITLSFWVRSSLTGTFGGSLQNNGNARSYPFTYTISSANTWEQKTLTIAGDTSGTWATNSSVGIWVILGLGVGSTYSGTASSWSTNNYISATGATSVVGTNGATFYITGVQLEKGSTATSFDYRPYGTELQLCQRYYYRTPTGVANTILSSGYVESTTEAQGLLSYPLMRTVPTLVASGSWQVLQISVINGTLAFSQIGNNTARANLTITGGTAGRGALIRNANDTAAYVGVDAEL